MPMERAFRHCDKDTLKVAMLKHEETFRQQVHELHRLYRIQKLLMRDLKRGLKSQRNLSTSPNGSCTEYNRGALAMCAYDYEHRYAARGRGGHVAAAMPTPRPALSLDVAAPVVEYVRSAEEEEDDDDEAEETDDDAELELTLAVGGAGAKKRYGEYPSGGESLSSSSTESDVLTVSGRDWRQGHGTPYHKRRPATGLEVVQVEDGVGVQPPPPLLFHWLSLKMA
ncbi:hypothetical protein Zm00014a_026965 [Zea mays]|uniref:Uncharacterized protein n=1 Tax=Zea mays TaxID=4577 RepID=A0A317Y317_MAIZE|nr:hypothetical protein Zm00014a_026965 [Zea mays]